MAQQGFYTDPPARRMAYDDDGSVLIHVTSNGTVVEVSDAQRQMLNDIDQGTPSEFSWGQNQENGYLVLIFPELRDVTAFYVNATQGQFYRSVPSQWEFSANTTTGKDGTWSFGPVFTAASELPDPAYRNPTSLGAAGVKAVRFFMSENSTTVLAGIQNLHLYGNKSAGQTPHRIEFVDASGVELGRDLDFGDVPRDTENVWDTVTTFNQSSGLYLKNISPNQQANTVVLSVEQTATDAEMMNEIQMSKDGISYYASLTWTNIQPSTVVGPVYIKYTTTTTSDFGLEQCRLQVDVASWT